MTNVYQNALSEALQILDMSDELGSFLEPRSALKQAASHYNISEGKELQNFVIWAEKEMYHQ